MHIGGRKPVVQDFFIDEDLRRRHHYLAQLADSNSSKLQD